MKKKVAVFICAALVLLISGCSPKPNKKEIENYIGDGMMTNIRLLIQKNEYFANKVFVYSHLPVDSGHKVTKDGKTYAPVISDDYSSYEALAESVKAIYTADVAESILGKYGFYTDIDGKLYFDLGKDFPSSASPVFNLEKVKTVSASNGEYILKLPYKLDGKNEKADIKIVLENGNPKLADFYPMTKTGE